MTLLFVSEIIHCSSEEEDSLLQNTFAEKYEGSKSEAGKQSSLHDLSTFIYEKKYPITENRMKYFKTNNQLISHMLIISFAFIFIGCAFDVIKIKKIPVQPDTSFPPKEMIVVEENLIIELSTGYKRTIEKGTKWKYVSQISYGDVFKTKDQILTIEGSNIYEAFIVVSEKQLVGFYLPVEQAFSPLSKPISFKHKMVDQ